MRLSRSTLVICGLLNWAVACKHRDTDADLTGKGMMEFVGTATHFDGVGSQGSGCGTPPDLMQQESGGRFAALNVQDTPGDYRVGAGAKPRPNTTGVGIGMWDNGRNCGRWIKVTLDDVCSGLSDGSKGKPLCQSGQYKPDAHNGATQYFLVSDSCADGNAWCRDDRFHVDLSSSGIKTFIKDGQQVTLSSWSNRKVRWQFVKAPNYRGDLKIGFVAGNFMQGSKGAWVSMIITNLPNGVSKVEAKNLGSKEFVTLTRVGDNGQKFDGLPTAGDEWLIRVYDYDGALINIGGKPIYKIKFPCGSERCPKLFNEPLGGITKLPS